MKERRARMGLSPATTSGPAVSRAATGIIDPSTGRPVGANDPYFIEVTHALSDKGFFVAAAVRRDDRGGHADQQDGARAAQGLRPDAGAALRDLDGVVRQWRRLLSLFLLGGARMRPHRARRYLRARLPADGGSTALRRAVAAEEDPAHR